LPVTEHQGAVQVQHEGAHRPQPTQVVLTGHGGAPL
jgi:hypothetical protein